MTHAYHINYKGEVVPCYAKKRPCPRQSQVVANNLAIAADKITRVRELQELDTTAIREQANDINNIRNDDARTELFRREAQNTFYVQNQDKISLDDRIEPGSNIIYNAIENKELANGFIVDVNPELGITIKDTDQLNKYDLEKIAIKYTSTYRKQFNNNNLQVNMLRDSQTNNITITPIIMTTDAEHARLLAEEYGGSSYIDLQLSQEVPVNPRQKVSLEYVKKPEILSYTDAIEELDKINNQHEQVMLEEIKKEYIPEQYHDRVDEAIKHGCHIIQGHYRFYNTDHEIQFGKDIQDPITGKYITVSMTLPTKNGKNSWTEEYNGHIIRIYANGLEDYSDNIAPDSFIQFDTLVKPWETEKILSRPELNICDICGKKISPFELYPHHYAGLCCSDCIDAANKDWIENSLYYTK